MITKVCGLTDRTDLSALASLGIDWGGFIFVRSSPRYVSRKVLVLPKGVKSVGVFRDEPVHSILHTASQWQLDGVQLHGDETPDEANQLREAGLFVLKAIGIDGDGAAGFAKAYTYGSDDIDYLLFDTPGGGTGRSFDWSMLDGYTGEVPFLLAGGIGPDSRVALDEIKHPNFAGIDLNSRFETSPGEKNLAALQTFLEA